MFIQYLYQSLSNFSVLRPDTCHILIDGKHITYIINIFTFMNDLTSIYIYDITNFQDEIIMFYNTPGTRGWSRLRDRTLGVPENRAKISFFFVKK